MRRHSSFGKGDYLQAMLGQSIQFCNWMATYRQLCSDGHRWTIEDMKEALWFRFGGEFQAVPKHLQLLFTMNLGCLSAT